MNAVEVNASPNVLVLARRVQCQLTTHTKADNAEPTSRRTAPKIVTRTAEILLCPIDVQRHHELPRVVGRRSLFSVVQVRCERHIAGCGETVGHVLDVTDETPPFLDDDHPWTTAFGLAQKTLRRTAVGHKLDDGAFLGHGCPFPGCQRASCDPTANGGYCKPNEDRVLAGGQP